MDLKIRIAGIQLLLRQVVVRALHWLLTVEELDSLVLKTVAGHRL
jgi:hypothetical protein